MSEVNDPKWFDMYESQDVSDRDIFKPGASPNEFPEAAYEIEKSAQYFPMQVPWCAQRKRRRKLLESLEGALNEHIILDEQDYPNSEHPRAGMVYEIDHGSLPLIAPMQLSFLRVVLVSEVTGLQVRVKFPSALSLSTFFKRSADRISSLGNGPQSQQETIMGTKPDLDEKFVMTSRVAEKVLIRPISCTELLHQGHLKTFWLVEDDRVMSSPQENDAGHVISSPKRWGIRRKISSTRSRGEMDKENLQLIITRSTRAPVLRPQNSEMVSSVSTLELPKDVHGRWSSDRYRAAQLKLVQILHDKGAKPGNTIVRCSLREEARKHIGDTGLLDHLLKHMVDTVVSDGLRFRRRHNSEGAMEYWLEDASLMEIRKLAGIDDPSWVPPPGWKPGDKLPERGYLCRGMTASEAAEMEQLKQEVHYLRSKMHMVLKGEPVPLASEPEILTENSHLAWEGKCTFKEKMKTQVENLKANIEELQSAYIQLHELHQDHTAFLQWTPKETGFESTNTNMNSGVQKESSNKEGQGGISERLEKLEVEIHKIYGESKARYETLAVEKLALETQLGKLWEAVLTMQEKMSSIIMTSQLSASNSPERAAVRSFQVYSPGTSLKYGSNPMVGAPTTWNGAVRISAGQTVVQLAETGGQHGSKLCRPRGIVRRPERPADDAQHSNSEVTSPAAGKTGGVADIENVNKQRMLGSAAMRSEDDSSLGCFIQPGENNPTAWLGLAPPDCIA